MTTTPVREIPSESQSEIRFPPGDLYSDEPPLESDLHLKQIILLLTCLEWLWKEKEDYFASGNLTIYYSSQQTKSQQYRGPDFFVVLNTSKKPRKSWVVWEEEGKYPHVIVEILSPSTAKNDREVKKKIYQDIFRTPNYFWFDPDSLEFQGFRLLGGEYEAIASNEQGWLWSEQLGLYLGIYEDKLRYFTPEGELVSSPQEAAIEEQQRTQEAQQRTQEAEQLAELERQRAQQAEQLAQAEQQRTQEAEQLAQLERQRAQAAEQRLQQLEERLRTLGIDLDETEL